MSGREGLARTIALALADVAGIYDTTDDEDLAMADAILAAGYAEESCCCGVCGL